MAKLPVLTEWTLKHSLPVLWLLAVYFAPSDLGTLGEAIQSSHYIFNPENNYWANSYGLTPQTPLVLSLPFCLAVLLLTTTVPYMLIAIACQYMDERPEQYRSFKLQQDAPPLSATQRKKAWIQFWLNLGVVSPVFGMACAYPVWKARGPPAVLDLTKEVLQLILVFPIVTDAWYVRLFPFGSFYPLPLPHSCATCSASRSLANSYSTSCTTAGADAPA